MPNMVIGVGNAGSRCVEEIASRTSMSDVILYAIDSVMSNMSMEKVGNKITYIPIVSDDKCGSGRDRERGAAMFRYHEENGKFVEMYNKALEAKTPVVVISSSAGGTGSGSIVPLCKSLIELDIQVIPVIICPSMDDPDAYHLNTNDLLIELDQVGVQTYNIFRNRAGTSNYTPVNNDVADMVEIIFGKYYKDTELDSIDDQDLDTILNIPGRFVAIKAKASDIQKLTREITAKMFTGYQPSWTDEEANRFTFMTAFSLRSIFAADDFENVFTEVRARIRKSFDEYRHIEQTDNNGVCEATVIIAGLPRPEIKQIDSEYADVGGLSEGMNRSKRPGFMKKKKASVVELKDGEGSAIKQFKWH